MEPVEVPIRHRGPETNRSPFLDVLIDSLRPFKKGRFGAKKLSVMVQSVDADLATTFTNLMDKLHRNFISLLWNKLEGGAHPILRLHVHHGSAEVSACLGLHVMGHQATSVESIGPVPDKRDVGAIECFGKVAERIFKKIVD